MKQIHKYALALVCMILATTSFTSCDWDNSPEPEHPLYVTYTISAGSVSFSGPDQLLTDILAWVKANSIIYDTKVNYTTGAASEFTATDADAIKKYENEFLPKFKAHLGEVQNQLAAGNYGKGAEVRASFYTYAKRGQGQQGDLKYEHIEFIYPAPTTN